MSKTPKCSLCGEPMPEGEEMFKYHGFSGPCPKEPVAREPEAPRLIEHGWLIEKTGGTSARYFSYECNTGAWSYDHTTAVRFARKQDAEAMAKILKQIKPKFMDGYQVCLHEWG